MYSGRCLKKGLKGDGEQGRTCYFTNRTHFGHRRHPMEHSCREFDPIQKHFCQFVRYENRVNQNSKFQEEVRNKAGWHRPNRSGRVGRSPLDKEVQRSFQICLANAKITRGQDHCKQHRLEKSTSYMQLTSPTFFFCTLMVTAPSPNPIAWYLRGWSNCCFSDYWQLDCRNTDFAFCIKREPFISSTNHPGGFRGYLQLPLFTEQLFVWEQPSNQWFLKRKIMRWKSDQYTHFSP